MTSRYAYEPLAYALHAGVASLFERLSLAATQEKRCVMLGRPHAAACISVPSSVPEHD